MIHFGGNFSDTRWVPFPKTPYIPQSLKEGVDALPEQTFLALTSIDEVVATEVLARAAPPYLKWLSEDMLGELEFMRNRSIVLIGESGDWREGRRRNFKINKANELTSLCLPCLIPLCTSLV